MLGVVRRRVCRKVDTTKLSLVKMKCSMSVKLLTELHLKFLSLGSSESELVKMPHCCKSRVTAHFISYIRRWMWVI